MRPGSISEAVADLLQRLIGVYQFLLSPWLGQHCRFHPSCSQYARDALVLWGPRVGGWLAVRRLARCHPWHAGGPDPVPPPPNAEPN